MAHERARHGRLTRKKLIQHRRKAVDIGPRIGHFTPQLLGRGVLDRADDGLAECQCEIRAELPHARYAEVDDLHAPWKGAPLRIRRDQDVGGLEVAVDHAALVRVRHRVAGLTNQTHALAPVCVC